MTQQRKAPAKTSASAADSVTPDNSTATGAPQLTTEQVYICGARTKKARCAPVAYVDQYAAGSTKACPA